MKKITLETLDQTYVLGLDILGFSKIVKNNRHQHLVELFENYVNTYNADLNLINKYYLNIVDNKRTEDLQALFISDSLIIYSLSAEIENFLKMVSLAQVIIANSFELGIPLRGCLTSGSLTIKHLNNNDILFGKPIVDAYEHEKEQEWAGCCISKRCLETVEKFHFNKNKPCLDWLLARREVINYKVPLKTGFKEMLVINWKIPANHIHLSESTIREAFLSHKKEPVSKEEQTKIDKMKNNTLEFWNSDIPC